MKNKSELTFLLPRKVLPSKQNSLVAGMNLVLRSTYRVLRKFHYAIRDTRYALRDTQYRCNSITTYQAPASTPAGRPACPSGTAADGAPCL
jgi:hypothetical protein